ncbi:MAG: SsrA-binding protein SmpB [Patescibacteria group bacterium]|nr:SsrA-binding protein SmpB [Patescibacteria group bacterium]
MNNGHRINIPNKKAHHDYVILETFEAGVVLSGGEIKSVRKGSASLADSFVRLVDQEAYLVNAYIAPYQETVGYDPRHSRKLLLHRKEILYLTGKIASSNLTLVPLKMYNKRNIVKVEVALARGKKTFEKRELLKRRAIEREVEQELREAKLKKTS